ncbi:MAG: sensor histidine kinase, partial [Thermodesulfobacteriota bacterium]
KRIAGDLHDGIGQCLSAVKFIVESSLEQLNGKVDGTYLNALKALIPLLQESSEEVRNIVMNLRPSILDDLGILATIGWFCRQFRAVYSHIRVEENIDLAEAQVPDSLKTILFRILQEAMNNVVKHSQADRVKIQLRKRGQAIEFTVRDNGRGFDADRLREIDASEKGFGITGMKERAELSGGVFEVDSAPERGTVIRAAWTYTKIRPIS